MVRFINTSSGFLCWHNHFHPHNRINFGDVGRFAPNFSLWIMPNLQITINYLCTHISSQIRMVYNKWYYITADCKFYTIYVNNFIFCVNIKCEILFVQYIVLCIYNAKLNQNCTELSFQCNKSLENIKVYMCLTLVGVLVANFITATIFKYWGFKTSMALNKCLLILFQFFYFVFLF